MLFQGKKEDYDSTVTMSLALSNDGQVVPSQSGSVRGLIPKGAKNVPVGTQPQILNEWAKTGLGRNLPPMASVVKNDPWWFEDPHRAAYTKQGLLSPTVANFWAYNPAYAQLQNEHVFRNAWAEIVKDGVTSQVALEKAIKGAEEIYQNS